jgi:hypothetical protein
MTLITLLVLLVAASSHHAFAAIFNESFQYGQDVGSIVRYNILLGACNSSRCHIL